MASNVTTVLFIMLLIYIGMLITAIVRLWKKLLKRENSYNYKVFKAFYVVVIIQIILSVITNATSLLTISQTDKQTFESSTLFQVVGFVMLPTILMVFSFTLMYY